jgi:hypothetical protein
MIEQGKALATQIGNFLGPSFRELGSAVAALMAGPFGSALAATARTLGTVIGGALVLALRTLTDGLTIAVRGLNDFSRWIANIPASLRNLGAAMQQAGRDVVEGVVRGFTQGTVNAVVAVRDLGQRVMATLKDTLGIKSPSRVFIGYGEMVAEGLALGIQRGTPEALRAALDMARQVAEITERQIVDSLTPQQERVFNIVQPAKGGLGNIMPTTGPVDNAAWTEAFRTSMAQAANDNTAAREAFGKLFSDGLNQALQGNGGNWIKEWWTNTLRNAFQNAMNNLGQQLFDIFAKTTGGQKSGDGGFMSTLLNIGSAILTGGKSAGTAGKMALPSTESMNIPSVGMTPSASGKTGSNVINLTVNSDFGAKQFVIDTARNTAVEVTGAGLKLAANQRQRAQRNATFGGR